jgi:hypothetical protein
MKRAWIPCVAIALTTTSACAGEATPQAAMDAFLQAELARGRLDADSRRAFIDKHVLAGPRYKEPDWEGFVWVNGATVEWLRCTKPERCTARVRYDLTPTGPSAPDHVMPHPKGGVQYQVYLLLPAPDGWRVATSPYGKPLGMPRSLHTVESP